MTEAQVFVLFVLPFIIALLAGVVALISTKWDRHGVKH